MGDPYRCEIHGCYSPSHHCPGCIQAAVRLIQRLHAIIVAVDRPLMTVSVNELLRALERLYALINGGIDMQGRIAPRLHKLGCDEYHAHNAPGCCAPECWCRGEAARG